MTIRGTITRRAGVASAAAALVGGAVAGPAAARCRKKTVTVKPAITQASFPAVVVSQLPRGGVGTFEIVATGGAMAFAFDAANEPVAVTLGALLPQPGTPLTFQMTGSNCAAEGLSFTVTEGELDEATRALTWRGTLIDHEAAAPCGYEFPLEMRDVTVAAFPPVS